MLHFKGIQCLINWVRVRQTCNWMATADCAERALAAAHVAESAAALVAIGSSVQGQ